MRRAVVGLLDQRLDLQVAGHAIGVGIFREWPEQGTEGMLFRVAHLLALEIDHLVAEQRVADFLELRIRYVGDIHAAYLGAHCRCQRQGLYVPVLAGVVVELAVGMQEHAVIVRGLQSQAPVA